MFDVHNYRFGLTSTALEQLLKLVSTLLPQPNHMMKSVYSIRKLLTGLFPYIITSRHKFCDYCQLAIEGTLFCHGKENIREFVL